jgi:hypothetical protein
MGSLCATRCCWLGCGVLCTVLLLWLYPRLPLLSSRTAVCQPLQQLLCCLLCFVRVFARMLRAVANCEWRV